MASKKTYSGFYIGNALVGGYSTKETLKTGSVMTGMADFVPVSKVLSLALRHRGKVSLAGGLWSRVGYRGWGQKVSVSEARKAVKKLKEYRG